MILSLGLAASLAAEEVSGDWNMKVSSPEGEHAAKLSLTQHDKKITGAIASERGQYQVEGTVNGSAIQFTVRYTGGDQPMTIPFTGKRDGDKMAGDYRSGDTTGTWTAEKLK